MEPFHPPLFLHKLIENKSIWSTSWNLLSPLKDTMLFKYSLIKSFSQLIHAPLDGRPAIDRRGGLDRRMPHLRLDHIERHLPGDGPRAKGVAQPVRGGALQAIAFINWQT